MNKNEFEIAIEYYNGEDYDVKEAIKLFEVALEKGYEEASYELAILYIDHFAESKDAKNKAYDYMRRSAENNIEDSVYQFGMMNKDNEYNHNNKKLCLKYLLLSNDLNNETRKIIKEKINLLSKNNKEKELDEKMITINFFNNCKLYSKDKEIIMLLNKKISELFTDTCNHLLSKIESIDAFENIFEFIKKYDKFDKNNHFLNEYYSKYGKHLLKESKTVVDSKKAFEAFTKISDTLYRQSNLNEYYYWLAQSYRDGIHSVSKNIPKAYKYYNKMTNIDNYVTEIDKMLISYVEELQNKNEIKKAMSYCSNVTHKENYKDIILNIKYEYKCFKSKEGDYDSMLYVAEALLNGKGTPVDVDKAIRVYEGIFELKKDKISLEKLVEHYINNDNKKVVELLEYGYRNNIIGDFYFKNNLQKIVKYAFDCYEKVKFNNYSGKLDDNVIYYIDYYYSFDKFVRNNPNNNLYRSSYKTFIAIKNGEYNTNFIYDVEPNYLVNYPVKIKNFVSGLSGEWIICTVPSSNKTNDFHNNQNNVYKVIDMISFNNNIKKEYGLIMRLIDTDKKHLSLNRSNDYMNDYRTIGVNQNINIKDKNILIIDDITTTGTSLIACRVLLLNSGAKNVICLALGKTKEADYGY